jgi:Matrixin
MIPVLVLFTFAVMPVVRSQTYSQPMLGVSWSTHQISVDVPTGPSWATTGIEDAMTDWNAAQSWFIQTYFPNQTEAQFTFADALDNSPSQVKIVYVSDVAQFWTGTTEVPTSGRLTNETVLVVLSRLAAEKDMFQVVEHELGHVLGLDHTKIPSDLMYAAQDAYSGGEVAHPSTLNLFAVYLLGMGCDFSSDATVNLPTQIPYIEWYPNLTDSNPAVSLHANQSIEQPNCPHRLKFWQEPSFLFPVVVVLLVCTAYFLNSRRKRTTRPTKFMEAIDQTSINHIRRLGHSWC